MSPVPPPPTAHSPPAPPLAALPVLHDLPFQYKGSPGIDSMSLLKKIQLESQENFTRTRPSSFITNPTQASKDASPSVTSPAPCYNDDEVRNPLIVLCLCGPREVVNSF
jgi:hypothetical protein